MKKVKAEKKLVSPSSFPPDPMVKFSLMNQPVESSMQSPMSSFQVMVNQNMPFPTKLVIKGMIQYQSFQIEEAKLDMLISQIKRDISLIYIDIVRLKDVLEVEKDKLSKIELINSIALTKYQLGKGLQQDLLKISVAELQTKKKIVKLKSMIETKYFEMSYLLGETNTDFHTSWDELLSQDYLKSTVKNNALRQFPLLKVKQALLSKRKSELNLARWDYLPDLGISLAYNFRDNTLPDGGVDQYTVGVTASAPIYSFFKQIPLNQSKKLSLESAQSELKDAELQVDKMIEMHYEMYLQDKEIVALYQNNILNESKQALDSSITAYQVDKVDFLNVLNSLLSLYQHQEEYLEFKASYLSHQSWLDFLQRP